MNKSNNTFSYVAQNGMRVVSKDWNKTIKSLDSDVVLQVIFHDPVFKELTK